MEARAELKYARISSRKVKIVIDKLRYGVGRESFADIADYLLGTSDYTDKYIKLKGCNP